MHTRLHSGSYSFAEATSKAAFLTIPGLLQENIEDIFVLPEAEVCHLLLNLSS